MTALTFPLELSYSVPDWGRIFMGLGRDASYEAAERGQIPVVRVGRTLRVITAPGLAQLGWTDALIARALGVALDEPRTDAEALSSRERATATIHVLNAAAKTGDHSDDARPPAG